MAFPDDPLALKVELHLAGAWTDVSPYVSDTDLVTIVRGIADEAGSADPATCRLTLENRDGRFSPRNPLSPYYGQLTRNTPLRVSVDQGDRSLDLLGLPTSRASTPDNAALELAGDADWRIDLEPDAAGWRYAHLASKYNITGSQRGWVIWLLEDGRVQLTWSQDGVATRQATSTAAIDMTQRRLAIRVVQQGNNGAGGTTITFSTAPSINGVYVQLGAPVVVGGGTASWFNNTQPLELGTKEVPQSGHPPGFAGRIHAFQMRTGLGAGSLVANPDFTIPAEGATAFTDSAGRSWTVAAGARIAPSGVRFAGEVSSWPPRWELAGRDVWAPIEAAGVLRRLQQGATPVLSVLRRVTLEAVPDLVAYWPCEEGADSRVVASPMPGVRPMKVKGRPEFGAFTDLPASAALPTLNDAQLIGDIPVHEGTGAFQVRFVLFVPESTGTGNGQSIMLIRTTNFLWHLAYMTTPNAGSLRVEAFDNEGNGPLYSSGGVDFTTSDPARSLLGNPVRVSIEFQQVGADIKLAFRTLAAGQVTAFSASNRTATGTLGKGVQLVVNNGGGIQDMSVGHVTYQRSLTEDPTSAFDVVTMGVGLDAYDRETAGNRMIRLAEENGLLLRMIGDPDDTVSMGPQRVGTLVDLLRECAAADGGLLCDDREMIGISYRTRTSLYNKPPTLTLDYDAGDLAGSLEPQDDDQFVRNLVTVTRTGGSSATVERTAGPLSTAAPPAGAGRYDEDVELSLAADSDTLHRAGWRLRLGTVDETRFPQISANLRELAADTALVPDAVAVDAGHRIAITNPPSWLPPEDIVQVVSGYTETLGNWERTLEFACTPASPYDVAVLGEARYSPSASTLAAGVDSAATALSVATSSGPLWTTAAGDMPIPIVVGGERMTVTAISGASSPQTFTVVRSVNGIVKSHLAGASVQLAEPSYRAL